MIIDIARNFIQKFNDRIFIGFDPVFLKTMPLINDSKGLLFIVKIELVMAKIPEIGSRQTSVVLNIMI